jgi:hypothetical protein
MKWQPSGKINHPDSFVSIAKVRRKDMQDMFYSFIDMLELENLPEIPNEERQLLLQFPISHFDTTVSWINADAS